VGFTNYLTREDIDEKSLPFNFKLEQVKIRTVGLYIKPMSKSVSYKRMMSLVSKCIRPFTKKKNSLNIYICVC